MVGGVEMEPLKTEFGLTVLVTVSPTNNPYSSRVMPSFKPETDLYLSSIIRTRLI